MAKSARSKIKQFHRRQKAAAVMPLRLAQSEKFHKQLMDRVTEETNNANSKESIGVIKMEEQEVTVEDPATTDVINVPDSDPPEKEAMQEEHSNVVETPQKTTAKESKLKPSKSLKKKPVVKKGKRNRA